MSSKVRENIVKIIKGAKYFSIMMDCTPDVSHQKQLSLIIRIVNLELESETSAPKIEEYFLDFISVESTAGLHLAKLIVSKLQEYNITFWTTVDKDMTTDQNMKGQYQGVQYKKRKPNKNKKYTNNGFVWCLHSCRQFPKTDI